MVTVVTINRPDVVALIETAANRLTGGNKTEAVGITNRAVYAGRPLLVEYSKCSAWPGWTMGKIACAATAASLNPCRISFSLPG
jgi:hypothetical protein